MADIIPTTGQLTFNYVRDFLLEHGGTSDGSINANASRMITASMIKAVFAKFKPVFVPAGFDKYSPDRTKAVNGKYWWVSDSDFCGFNLNNAKAGSFADLPNKYDGGMNGWVYEVPQGVTNGNGNPFRIDDFRGYNAYAPNIMQGFYVQPNVSNASTSVMSQIMIAGDNGDNITWKDFPTLKNYYFGVYLRKNDGTVAIRVTATANLENSAGKGADDGTSFMPYFDASKLGKTGSYTAYPFICSRALTQADNSSNQGDVIYTLPIVQPVAVEITSDPVNFTFLPRFTYNNGAGTSGNVDSINLLMSVDKSSTGTENFTNVLVNIRYRNSDPSSGGTSGEMMGVKPNPDYFSVSQGFAKPVNLGTITGVSTKLRNNCKVYVSFKDSSGRTYEVVGEPTSTNIGQ